MKDILTYGNDVEKELMSQISEEYDINKSIMTAYDDTIKDVEGILSNLKRLRGKVERRLTSDIRDDKTKKDLGKQIMNVSKSLRDEFGKLTGKL